jgi:hypothetical protein
MKNFISLSIPRKAIMLIKESENEEGRGVQK